MVSANVFLLEDFIATIRCICEEQELKHPFLFSSSAFVRHRKLSFSTVTFIVLSMLKKSLNIELQHFFNQSIQWGISPCSKSAFCQQRQKISSQWFKFLLEYIAGLFYQQASLVKRWKGYKIISVDGSTAFLVNSKEVQQHYQGGRNQFGGYALGRYMKMYDVLNGITLKAELMPFNDSERMISYAWTDAMQPDAITLFDRGFPAYTLFFLMQYSEAPKPFVMRCKKNFTRSTGQFAASDLTEGLIYFYPDERAIKTLRNYQIIVKPATGIALRAVKIILPDGAMEILITNLLDSKTISNEDLANLYRMRWTIETDIGKEKNLFQLENFSSHTRNSIEQDFYASFIVANIHQIIASEANKAVKQKVKHRKYDYRINTSASLGTFKKSLVQLYYTEKLKTLLIHLQNQFQEFVEPVRPNRKIARIKRTKRRYGKHQTQTNYRNNI